MKDSVTRQQALIENTERWDPQARDKLRALLTESNILADDINAVMANLEKQAP